MNVMEKEKLSLIVKNAVDMASLDVVNVAVMVT